MKVADFDFTLPPELIAQQPAAERDTSRMMTLDRRTGVYADRHIRDLPGLLRAGDVLVMNDSRVIPARLLGKVVDAPAPGRTVEVLLVEQREGGEWSALAKPARLLRRGARVVFGENGELEAEILAEGDFGERTLCFQPCADFWQRLDEVGHVPLPPYIRRADQPEDRARYQTVVARAPGSVAAPTAGLHFTPQLLDEIRARGVHVHTVTLHVGLGTFQPVRCAEAEQHMMHEERYTLPADTAAALRAARAEKRRIIAVGTTVVRTLEHCARLGHGFQSHSGRTGIFLYPGAKFLVVDAMLTNFHLPQSTLLMLVCAFAGREPVLRAYEHAVAERYRFFSYGDCMFLS